MAFLVAAGFSLAVVAFIGAAYAHYRIDELERKNKNSN